MHFFNNVRKAAPQNFAGRDAVLYCHGRMALKTVMMFIIYLAPIAVLIGGLT